METPLRRWRRRCGEGWIADADADALAGAYAAFGDERARHPGPIRVQLVDPNPLIQLAGLFAALDDADPVDVFVTPGHGLPAEMAAYEAAAAGDFFWSGREFVVQFPGETQLPTSMTFNIGADGNADSFTHEEWGLFTRVRK